MSPSWSTGNFPFGIVALFPRRWSRGTFISSQEQEFLELATEDADRCQPHNGGPRGPRGRRRARRPSLGPEQGAHRSHTRVRGTCLWPRGHGTARGSQEECGQASGIFLEVDVWVLGHRRGIRGGGIACAVRVACRLWKLGELPLNIHAHSSSHAQDVHSWVTRARRVVDPHTHHLQSNLGVSSLPPAKTPNDDVTSLNFYSQRALLPRTNPRSTTRLAKSLLRSRAVSSTMARSTARSTATAATAAPTQGSSPNGRRSTRFIS